MNNNTQTHDYMFTKLMVIIVSLVIGDMIGFPILVMGIAVVLVVFGEAAWELLNAAADLITYGVMSAAGKGADDALVESAVERIKKVTPTVDSDNGEPPPAKRDGRSRVDAQPSALLSVAPSAEVVVRRNPTPSPNRPNREGVATAPTPRLQQPPQPQVRHLYDDGPIMAVTSLPSLDSVLGAGSVFIYGRSGAGKTSVMKHILARRGECLVADPHSAPGKWPNDCTVIGSTERGPNFSDIASGIGSLVRKMNDRYGDIATGRAEEGRFKPICLATDEYLAIVSDKLNGDKIAENLTLLLVQGRKVNISVVVSSQDRSVASTGFSGKGFLRETFAFVRVSGSVEHNLPFECFVSFGMDGAEIEVEHPGSLPDADKERPALALADQIGTAPTIALVGSNDNDDGNGDDDDDDGGSGASIELDRLPAACRLMAKAGFGASDCAQLFGVSEQIVGLVFDSLADSASGVPKAVSAYANAEGMPERDCVAICALTYAGVSANRCADIIPKRRLGVLSVARWAKSVGVSYFIKEQSA